MPMTGFHSVIESPESVKRVIPPTTTIRNIVAQQMNSQAATGARPPPTARSNLAPLRAAAAVDIDKRDPRQYRYTDVRQVRAPPRAGKCGGCPRRRFSRGVA